MRYSASKIWTNDSVRKIIISTQNFTLRVSFQRSSLHDPLLGLGLTYGTRLCQNLIFSNGFQCVVPRYICAYYVFITLCEFFLPLSNPYFNTDLASWSTQLFHGVSHVKSFRRLALFQNDHLILKRSKGEHNTKSYSLPSHKKSLFFFF